MRIYKTFFKIVSCEIILFKFRRSVLNVVYYLHEFNFETLFGVWGDI